MANIKKYKAIRILLGLKQRARKLIEDYDSVKFDIWHRDVEVAINNIFGVDNRNLRDFIEISYGPEGTYSRNKQINDDFKGGMKLAMATIQSMIDEIRQFWIEDNDAEIIPNRSNEENDTKMTKNSNRVFIVHGHDEIMKESVARTVTRLGLNPVILHEQPNKGRTIIEKFTDYSDVSFAIILLSPDDRAYPVGKSNAQARLRARQNVVFELGYFIGKLGRDRVLPIYKGDQDFEMPSDYSGVLYTPFDDAGAWAIRLVKELQSCGFSVDANQLVN